MPPPPEDQPRESWGWTRTQRMVLAFLLLIMLAFLAVQFSRRPARWDDPNVIINGQPVTLPQRIDPNAATAEELARIAHLGDKIAGKIIDWRTSRKPQTPDGLVFHSIEDLDHVPGVSKKLVEELRPFLKFPDDTDTEPSNQ